MPAGLAQRNINLPNIGESLHRAREYRADRQRAYAEGFEEFVHLSKPVTLNGQLYRAHPNINLYIDMAEACNADCEWCIAKVNFKRKDTPIKGIGNRILAALDFCEDMQPSIQVTGGEPTLFRYELGEISSMFQRHPDKIKRPVLNTNGYRLAGCLQEVDVYKHINISRHHYNENINAHIMKVRPRKMSNWHLQKAVEYITDRVRLQCNLLSGEIDTYGEVMQMIAFAYHKLGIRNIVFAQLTPLPTDSFYDQTIIDCIKDEPVDVDSILSHVEQDSCFTFEKYRGGVACYYEVWKFTAYEEPITVVFKYSDNHWLEKADNNPQLLPDLILHTDGTLSGSWCKDRKVLTKFQ